MTIAAGGVIVNRCGAALDTCFSNGDAPTLLGILRSRRRSTNTLVAAGGGLEAQRQLDVCRPCNAGRDGSACV
jgi:hypothetical protein